MKFLYMEFHPFPILYMDSHILLRNHVDLYMLCVLSQVYGKSWCGFPCGFFTKKKCLMNVFTVKDEDLGKIEIYFLPSKDYEGLDEDKQNHPQKYNRQHFDLRSLTARSNDDHVTLGTSGYAQVHVGTCRYG